jgi:DNA-binding transcriptional MocR family regulator
MNRTNTSWKPKLAERRGPLYLAIADALEADLLSGKVKPGDRLPAQRELAAALSIDFTTVGRAFAEARRRGLIEATVGRGSFARQRPGSTGADVSTVDMTMNLPPQPASLDLRGRIEHGLAAVLARPDFASLTTYRDAAGAPADRRAGQAWLAPRLPDLPADRVVVASGAQTAIAATLMAIAKSGDRGAGDRGADQPGGDNPGSNDLIVTEALTYPGLRLIAQQLGLRLQGLAMDEHGLLPSSLDEACRHLRPKALYCVPVLHNPTTSTMPEGRRREIAEIARRHRLPIIEDDTYGLLARQAPPPLASFAPDLTYYIGGLAKVLTPMLRVAYLVAPAAAMASRLANSLRGLTGMAPPLMVALATHWIMSGEAGDMLTALRQESMARQRLAADMLPAHLVQTQPEAHHLWLRLPKAWPRAAFVNRMQQHQLALVPSDAFAVAAPEDSFPPDAVRLCLGAAPDQRALYQSLATLAATLQENSGDMALAPVV